MRARRFASGFIFVSAPVLALVVLWLVPVAPFGSDKLNEIFSSLTPAVGSVAEALRLAEVYLSLVWTWLVAQYQTAPTLLLGLAIPVALPAIALLAGFVRWIAGAMRSDDEGDRYHHRDEPLDQQDASSEYRLNMHALKRPTIAMVDIHGGGSLKHWSLSQPVVQIGRSQDVDIMIEDPTVHRHHATIHCADDATYVVTDLGAGTGDGVIVNGLPVMQSKIFDGDEIRLGRARLKFFETERTATAAG